MDYKTREVAGLRLFYATEEAQTADLVAEACVKSLSIVQQHWGLAAPAECRVYVMTSWQDFLNHAAPWSWRAAMAVARPVWGPRAAALWNVAGGFHQTFGRRRVIGVKPPRLLAEADRSIGDRIFVRPATRDLEQEVQHVTCHELAHACMARLRPPMWLNEGVAMLTVDLYNGAPTIQDDTLEILARGGPVGDSSRYQDLDVDDSAALSYHAVRSYWLTRFLNEQHPDALRTLLGRPSSRRQVTRLLAQSLGVSASDVWQQIDGLVVARYR